MIEGAPFFDIAQKLAVGGAQVLYLHIPASTLRGVADGLFPGLAVDKLADCAVGAGHRWRAGHDLLVDVAPRLCSDPSAGLHQAGHILATDFPTKAGIPIPGFSQSGLGHFLTEMGIPSGFLSMNIMDAGVGIFAIAESHADMLRALDGHILDTWTFFDTYVEGAAEIYVGIQTGNPLLLVAGAENVASGVIETCNLLDEMFISMEEFFGGSLTGALVGLAVALAVSGQLPPRERAAYVLSNTARAALLGGLSVISPFFSLGAAAGFYSFELLRKWRKNCLAKPGYTPEMAEHMLQECLHDPEFARLWQEDLAELLRLKSEDAGWNALIEGEHARLGKALQNFAATPQLLSGGSGIPATTTAVFTGKAPIHTEPAPIFNEAPPLLSSTPATL